MEFSLYILIVRNMLTKLGPFIDPWGISLLYIFVQSIYSFKLFSYFEFVSFSLTSDSQDNCLEVEVGADTVGQRTPFRFQDYWDFLKPHIYSMKILVLPLFLSLESYPLHNLALEGLTTVSSQWYQRYVWNKIPYFLATSNNWRSKKLSSCFFFIEL